MKIAIISILIIGIATILIVQKQKTDQVNEEIESKKLSKVTSEEFLKTIDSLGYFKYTDIKDIQKLKQNQLESFDPEGSWGGMWDDETNLPLDFRYYFCDGEYVFEQGGFTGMLEKMDSTFKKIGFELNIENHFEEWDSENEWVNHRIKINGTDYVIFKNFKGHGWGEAVQRLAEVLNAALKKQEIEEKIYLINGGNDGSLIFLNNELYKYFYETFTDPLWKPLEVNEWAKVMEVKKMSLE